MKRKKRIKSILINNLSDWKIEIIDNSNEHAGHNNFDGMEESHFKVILKKNSLQDYSILEIHRKINNLLKEEFISGLHALEIKII